MNRSIWLLFIVLAVILFASTSLLYKAGANGVEKEKHTCLKYSICVGIVFFVIAFLCLITRKESFTIFESAVRFWPMTIFGIVYAVVNTISFNGYIYNEAIVESPVEGIGGGTSTILLIIAYLVLGRVDSIFDLLTPLRTIGIIIILISIIFYSSNYLSLLLSLVLLSNFSILNLTKILLLIIFCFLLNELFSLFFL